MNAISYLIQLYHIALIMIDWLISTRWCDRHRSSRRQRSLFAACPLLVNVLVSRGRA